MEEQAVLTKSLYTTGLDNAREMWFDAHDPSHPDAEVRWRMKQGQEVGEEARRRFPDGEFVGGPPTRDQLQSGRPLFEATFSANGLKVRTDILVPESTGWRIREVKGSTMSRSDALEDAKHDLAFQVHVLESCGLDIERAEIAYLNGDCVYPCGDDLFQTTSLGSDREELLRTVQTTAPRLHGVLQQDRPPDKRLSRQCNTCSCSEPCSDLPEQSIFTLPDLHWRHMDDLLDEGRATLEEVDGHSHLKPRHERYIEAVRAQQSWIDSDAVRDHLEALTYPLCFLDFEAASYAVPRFDRTTPWDRIPFQYSLHILTGDGDLAHSDYLHRADDDPRPVLLEHLLSDLPNHGSVVVYNAPFERRILEELQEAFPSVRTELQSIIDRLWDQAEIFKNWHYMHPAQKGSWSLKKVLPVFDQDLAYDDLEVQSGMEAVIQFDAMIHAESQQQRDALYHDLRAYCERDTLATVQIHRKLCQLVG